MSFDEKIKQAYSYLDVHCRNLQEIEDIKQDVALYLWEHQDENIIDVCIKIKKERLGDEYKHQRMRAKSIYNDDGECVDDDIYYVDERTIEYNEEKSPVTEEQRETVSKMEKTLQAIDIIYTRNWIKGSEARIQKALGRTISKKISQRKGQIQWITKGLIKSSMNSWSGLQNLNYQKRLYLKRLNEPRQWLC